MSHRSITFLRFAVIVVVASMAYSGDSPVTLAQNVPGSYVLSFFKSGPSGLEPVSSLPVCTSSVCEELILNAHITEESSRTLGPEWLGGFPVLLVQGASS